MNIHDQIRPRSPLDTEAGDTAFAWATDALESLATEQDDEQPKVLAVRRLAEAAVLEALGLHHEDAEGIVTEVERRIEGLFHAVGTA